MATTQIPTALTAMIGVAAEIQAAILIYERDVVVFANEGAQAIYACQDWTKPVLFDRCFRRAVELGRIQDRSILDDPETHLAYAKMARAREPNFQFRRRYDGRLFDRYHTGLDCDWNAQIWIPVQQTLSDAAPQDPVPPSLLEQVERSRALLTATALLERMGVAMAAVNAQAKLLDSSALMKRHLRTGTVFERDLGNRLACRDAESTARLRKAIAAVATGREGAALVPLPNGEAAQLVAVMPAPADAETAIVVVQDVAQPGPLQDILVSAFGLTKRQAEVVVRVAGGETADQIALALDRKLDTVRRQIATSKAKIAAGGQQDLARIVTRAAALFGGITPPKY